MIPLIRRGRDQDPWKQRLLPELERARRLERRFKRAIVMLTIVGIVGLFGGSTAGRYAVARLVNRVRWGLPRLIGYPPDRREIDEELRLRRAEEIARSAEVYRDYFQNEVSPEWRRRPRSIGPGAGRGHPPLGQRRRDGDAFL